MILKGFKEKSNKKYIDTTLKKRIVVGDTNKVKKVGVLVSIEESIDYNMFRTLSEDLGIEENKVEVIAFTSEKKTEDCLFKPTYNSKDLGWKGVMKHPELKTFVNAEFDVLISYYKQGITGLKLITTASKAKLKVGILTEDERLNDLIIKTELMDFEGFRSELIKYLDILNKI